MACKFFTSDFHLGMAESLVFDQLPFETIEQHDKALLMSCKSLAKPEDVIYHLGDLACYHSDRNGKGLSIKPYQLIKDIPATFLNIRGNHDLSNKVKSTCDSMHMRLSKRYPSVSLSHYPTFDHRIDASCLTAPIHLCGHVHRQFRHCLDLDHKILNVNVGCMVWNFKIISENELITYLNRLFKMQPSQLYRCKTVDGKLEFAGDNRV